MRTSGFLLSWLLFAGSTTALAASLSETFDTRTHYASGSAIWNQALGKIHPTLQAMEYDIFGSPPALPLDVGDGSDGVFDNTTYASFSVSGDVSGQIIRLDTDVHQSLQVTSFTLDAGWKVIPVGSHPLIIKSLSTVKIQGEIHCEGDPGGNSVGAAIGTGGIGRCGGKNGGDGGLTAASGANGVDADALVTGGGGGNFVAGTSTGGGGGAGWSSVGPTAAPHAGGANGGQGGISSSDPEFTILKGSSGGGGGSGDAASAGGGGGGGGGLVIIFAVSDIDIGTAPSSTTGFIYAKGGKGGDASGNGGPGGGGGGGSVQMFSAGGIDQGINLYNTSGSGASQATGGPAGTNLAGDVGSIGGLGRSWTATPTFFMGGTGNYNPTEEAPATVGRTEFSPAIQNVVTTMFDRGTKTQQIDSLVLSPASSDFTFEVAGSSDGFVLDDTGFTTNVSLITGKRYLKMRLGIHTSNTTTPKMIDTATILDSIVPQDEFNFKSAGCGRVDGGAPGNFLLILIAPLMLLVMRYRSRTRARLEIVPDQR